MDSLYTSSVLAIRPKTGEIVCYYQYTPNDVYDVDGTDEHVLADMQVGGQPRKVMIQANKNGFMYRAGSHQLQTDRGAPVRQGELGDALSISPPAGRCLTDVYKRFLAGEEVEIWPQRGTNAVPIAFNPNTGLIYTTSWNLPRIQKLAPPKPQVLGADSTGVVSRPPTIQAGRRAGPLRGDQSADRREEMGGAADRSAEFGGHARDRRRARVHRQMTGEFVALDEETGKTLWQFKTGSSVNSTAITYTHKGQQYVTVASGLGGNVAKRFAADKVPTGGSMWTFALMPE